MGNEVAVICFEYMVNAIAAIRRFKVCEPLRSCDGGKVLKELIEHLPTRKKRKCFRAPGNC